MTVVLAPLTEEVLFRGLIRTELRTHMKPRAAALLGALLFGLYHGNISQGIYAFLLALCLEPVCEWADVCFRQCFCTREPTGSHLFYGSGVRHAGSIRGQSALAVAAGMVLTAAALYKTKEVFGKS